MVKLLVLVFVTVCAVGRAVGRASAMDSCVGVAGEWVASMKDKGWREYAEASQDLQADGIVLAMRKGQRLKLMALIADTATSMPFLHGVLEKKDLQYGGKCEWKGTKMVFYYEDFVPVTEVSR